MSALAGAISHQKTKENHEKDSLLTRLRRRGIGTPCRRCDWTGRASIDPSCILRVDLDHHGVLRFDLVQSLPGEKAGVPPFSRTYTPKAKGSQMIKKIKKLQEELGLEIEELWWSDFDFGWICDINAPEGWGFLCQYHSTSFFWLDPYCDLPKTKVWNLVAEYARDEATDLCKCDCGYWEETS